METVFFALTVLCLLLGVSGVWFHNSCEDVPIEGCVCDTGAGRLRISCVNVGLDVQTVTYFSELSDVGYIELSNNNLTVLAEDTFSDSTVQSLQISNNSPLDIDEQSISGNAKENMEYLILSSDGLQRVPITIRNMRNLKSLDLSHNNITTLGNDDFDGLLNLISLYLMDNPIQNIDRTAFGPFYGLEELAMTLDAGSRSVSFQDRLGSNNLVYLDGSLEVLTVDDTILTDVEFLTEIKNLQSIRITLCNLRSRDLVSFVLLLWVNSPNLETVDFSKNLISDFPSGLFYKCHNLRYLDLSDNNINFLFYNSIRFPSLEYLDLSRNRLYEINNGAFNLMPDLKFLDLSGNRIAELDASTLPVDLFGQITLSIGDNPYRCSCDLLWLAEQLTNQAEGHNGPFPIYDIYSVQCTDGVTWFPLLDMYRNNSCGIL